MSMNPGPGNVYADRDRQTRPDEGYRVNINQRDNVLLWFAQRVPPAGLEADPVAQRGAGQPCLAVPHDPVPGLRVGEHQLLVAFGDLAAEQGHDHDVPSDDGVDGDRSRDGQRGPRPPHFSRCAGAEGVAQLFDICVFRPHFPEGARRTRAGRTGRRCALRQMRECVS